jgi:hypothetical protein
LYQFVPGWTYVVWGSSHSVKPGSWYILEQDGMCHLIRDTLLGWGVYKSRALE